MTNLPNSQKRKLPLPSPGRYPDTRVLYEDLKQLESAAILFLRDRIWGVLLKWGKRYGVSFQDLEEITNDAIVLTIQKIEIVERQLTQYTTTDALRSKRSGCLKKLGHLMTRFKQQLLEK